MPIEKTVDLATFRKDVERFGREGSRYVAVELQRDMQGDFRTEVLQRAPVGSREKKRKLGKVGAGEFKRSIVSVPNASAIQAGQPSYVASGAPHGNVLERGRKLGRSVKEIKGVRRGRNGVKPKPRKEGKPRMMGSTQAPQGIFGVSVDALDRKRDSIMAKVIERAEKALL